MDNNLNEDYKALINNLNIFLERMQSEVELNERLREKKANLINVYQPILFDNLDKAINELEKIASDFDEEKHRLHRKYLQKVLHHIALKSPFNKRCYEKPLGYPGDYLTMEMIYSDPYQGDSIFAQLLNVHSLTLPITKAVRIRGQYIKKMIEETINEIPNACILNVGAGPAWEVRDFIRDVNECNANFYLLDQEKQALEFLKKKLDGYINSISFLNKGVTKLIKEGFKKKFDLIYSTGLFDYISDKFARRLIRCLYNSLKKGGRLVIGNAKFNPYRIWMEHGTEWYLMYRNKKNLLDLTEDLLPASTRIYVNKDEGMEQIFIFLMIEK